MRGRIVQIGVNASALTEQTWWNWKAGRLGNARMQGAVIGHHPDSQLRPFGFFGAP